MSGRFFVKQVRLTESVLCSSVVLIFGSPPLELRVDYCGCPSFRKKPPKKLKPEQATIPPPSHRVSYRAA